MAKRNPAWCRDELILASDLYFKLKPSEFKSNNPKIVDLRSQLKILEAYSNPSDIEK